MKSSGFTQNTPQLLKSGFDVATSRTLKIDTHSTDHLIPLKRWALPEEIGQMAVFYASSAAASVTGSILLADGGATLLSKPAADYGL